MPGLVSLTAFVLVAGVEPPGQALDVAAIQRAIELQGADWVAASNWVTELTQAERQRLLGWDVASEPQPVHRAPPGVPLDQPPYLDWRDYAEQNYVTPVKDQGQCGSCWAFGSLGAMESRLAIEGGVSDPALDLSEQYLVSCATDDGCDGHSIQGTLAYIQYNGAVDEPCMLYEASDAIPCEDHCADS
jgi:C1A family cysteine protease